MAEGNDLDLFSYESTYKMKELHPYDTEDNEGNKIKVMPKDPANHDSWNQWEAHPTVFYNIGSIIKNPTRMYPSPSNNPRALQHLEDGRVLIYEKDDYMFDIKVPFVTEPIGDVTTVIVKYDDLKNENYTLSYRIDKK